MNRLPLLLSILLTFLISACGESGTNSRQAAAEAAQKTYGNVNLITSRYLPQDQEVYDAFEKLYRLKVNVEVVPNAEIIRRAQNDQLKGDVVIVPTLEDIVRLKNFGQLQPFYIDAFSRGNVDDRYMDDQGYFAALSRWTMAAVYNPKFVAIDEVKNYISLAKLPARGMKVGMAHPDSSGLAATVSGISRIVNEKAAILWTKVLYNNITPSGSDYDVMERLQRGEIDVAFVSSGAAVRWFLNGDPAHFELGKFYKIKYPTTATDDVNFFNMTSIGVIKNAPNRVSALQLINHLYQKENQEKMGTAVFEYPAEAYSISDEYLGGISDYPGRRVSATQMAERIPLAWEIINRVAAGE